MFLKVATSCSTLETLSVKQKQENNCRFSRSNKKACQCELGHGYSADIDKTRKNTNKTNQRTNVAKADIYETLKVAELKRHIRQTT